MNSPGTGLLPENHDVAPLSKHDDGYSRQEQGMKQRAHVLIVDDQADNLLILEDVLSEHY